MGGINVIEVAETPNERQFEGFEAAVTGSSCYNLNLIHTENRNYFLSNIFLEDWLGMSVYRLSIGGSDYSSEPYTYDDAERDLNLRCFSRAGLL